VKQINAVSSHEKKAPLVQSYGLWGEACHMPHQAYLPLVPTICEAIGKPANETVKSVVKPIYCNKQRSGLNAKAHLASLLQEMKNCFASNDFTEMDNGRANHVYFFVFQIPSFSPFLASCISELHEDWQQKFVDTYKVRFIWLFEAETKPAVKYGKWLPALANVERTDIDHFVLCNQRFEPKWKVVPQHQEAFSMQEVLELLTGADYNPYAMQPDHSARQREYDT